MMGNMIKKIPIPLCGVMLGTAALGNLLQSYSEGIQYICGGIAGFLFMMVLLKLLLYPEIVREDLKNPILASVAGAFSMSLMLLSVYVKPWLGAAAYGIWLLAIGLHILLILYFTVKFIVKLHMPKVFASYYIVYVGIVTASVTAPSYEREDVGNVIFWFGFISLILLLVLITIRYIKYREIGESEKPLICIYAAPFNLCIVGYLQSVEQKNYEFLIGMFIVASMLYVFALVKAVSYLRLPFYPSYASFTFPFVISATAAKQIMNAFADRGDVIPYLQYVVLIETIIATIFVVYTLIRFLWFLSVRTWNCQKM